MGTVESVRGGQLDDLLGQEHRGEGCNTIFLVRDKILACILFLLPPNTKGQWKGAATVHVDQRVVVVLE
jgi:hypothetical protein